MARLTRKLENGRYAQNYTTGDGFFVGMTEMMQKLGRLEDLEEAGRLVELPCKRGDIVWVSKNKEKTRRVLLDSVADILWYMEHGYGIGFTRKEAEAALKGAE